MLTLDLPGIDMLKRAPKVNGDKLITCSDAAYIILQVTLDMKSSQYAYADRTFADLLARKNEVSADVLNRWESRRGKLKAACEALTELLNDLDGKPDENLLERIDKMVATFNFEHINHEY